MTNDDSEVSYTIVLAINSMSKCTILGDNTTCDCSEACSSTWLHLVQLQASERVTHDHGIISQIMHLDMLLILY